MLVVNAFHPGDWQRSVQLFEWIAEIDGGPPFTHSCLLVASAGMTQENIVQVYDAAKKSLGYVSVIKQRDRVIGWPEGPNSMFKTALLYVESDMRVPFLWLESDSTPLQRGWLDKLQAEYKRQGKPIMGAAFDWVSRDRRFPHINGNAIYSPDFRKFNPYAANATQLPFDCIRPDLTLRYAHKTNLIHLDWGDRITNEPPTFPDQFSVDRIPAHCLLHHRCKDGSLVARLRERRNNVSIAHSKPTILSGIRRKVKALIRGGSTTYHSGNLGDIVYSLYAIKAYGGGDLILGPKQNGTSPCSVPITKEQFDLFLPLLKQQKYLKHVEFSPAYPAGRIQFDLNLFRNDWNNWPLRQREDIHTLCQMHFYSLGIAHRFNEDEAWLYVPDPIFHGQIVVHRSARYRSNDFPWSKLAARFASQMLFVGHEAEWKTFCSDVCKNVAFWKVTDFLQLARVIAGAKYFIGNQSFPLSLAIGMRQRVICEEFAPSPDCRFERECYASQNKGMEKIEGWL